MLNYTETASTSTIVPLTPLSSSQQQEQSTEPLPEIAQPQVSLPWSIDEDFGFLLYKGKRGEIHLPGVIWTMCDAAFAQGFWRGHALMREREDGDWYILTDQQFSQLIAHHLPATLPTVAIAPWKQGFIFGWCMTWYYQPFLDEEVQAEAEEEVRAAALLARRKRGKGTRCPRPKYPNALRPCIKQAGYTLREVSQETAIPESTLRRWAAGRQVIPHAFRERLAQVIGCSAEELAPKPVVVPV